jgi:cell division protein ZapC
MLKPSDKWNWYFCPNEGHLMLDLGNDMIFKTNLPEKLLVECAFAAPAQFTVDDASDYQTYRECVSLLDLSEPRQAELVLNCVAAKRFHKPVQPKSWFFESQRVLHTPEEGEVVKLNNRLNSGYFMVLEMGENSSLCSCVELDGFKLNEGKELPFGQPIKVMHDRMQSSYFDFVSQPIAMVG